MSNMSKDPLRNGDIFTKYRVWDPDLFRPYMPDPLQDPNKTYPPKPPHPDEDLLREAKEIKEKFNALYRATPSIKDIFSSSTKAKKTPAAPASTPQSHTTPSSLPYPHPSYSTPHYSPIQYPYPYAPPPQYPPPYYMPYPPPPYSPSAASLPPQGSPQTPHAVSYFPPYTSLPHLSQPVSPAVVSDKSSPPSLAAESPDATPSFPQEELLPASPLKVIEVEPSAKSIGRSMRSSTERKHDGELDNHRSSVKEPSSVTPKPSPPPAAAPPSRRARMTAGDSLANLAAIAKARSSTQNTAPVCSHNHMAEKQQNSSKSSKRSQAPDSLLAGASPAPKKQSQPVKKKAEKADTTASDPRKEGRPSKVSDVWSAEERRQLSACYNRIPLNTSNFWEAVAVMLPNRTAEECQKQWFHELDESEERKKAKIKKKATETQKKKEAKPVMAKDDAGKKKKYTRAQLQSALEQTFRGHSDDAYEHVVKKHKVQRDDARLAAALDTQKNALLSLRSPTDKDSTKSKITDVSEEASSEFSVYSSAAYANKLLKQTHGAAAVALPKAKRKTNKRKAAAEDINIEDGGGDYHIAGKVSASGQVKITIDEELREIDEFDDSSSIDDNFLFLDRDM